MTLGLVITFQIYDHKYSLWKKKMSKLDIIKIKTFFSVKAIVERMKRQATKRTYLQNPYPI